MISVNLGSIRQSLQTAQRLSAEGQTIIGHVSDESRQTSTNLSAVDTRSAMFDNEEKDSSQIGRDASQALQNARGQSSEMGSDYRNWGGNLDRLNSTLNQALSEVERLDVPPEQTASVRSAINLALGESRYGMGFYSSQFQANLSKAEFGFSSALSSAESVSRDKEGTNVSRDGENLNRSVDGLERNFQDASSDSGVLEDKQRNMSTFINHAISAVDIIRPTTPSEIEVETPGTSMSPDRKLGTKPPETSGKQVAFSDPDWAPRPGWNIDPFYTVANGSGNAPSIIKTTW